MLSYSHLTLQNNTFSAFAPVLRARAGVAQVLTASPLSMGLLTSNPTPSWHPAPEGMRLVAAQASSLLGTQDGGLSRVAIAWAVHRAEEGKTRGADAIATLIGLSSPLEVHQAVAAWRKVQADGEDTAVDEESANQVIQMFEQSGFKDWSWSSP